MKRRECREAPAFKQKHFLRYKFWVDEGGEKRWGHHMILVCECAYHIWQIQCQEGHSEEGKYIGALLWKTVDLKPVQHLPKPNFLLLILWWLYIFLKACIWLGTKNSETISLLWISIVHTNDLGNSNLLFLTICYYALEYILSLWFGGNIFYLCDLQNGRHGSRHIICIDFWLDNSGPFSFSIFSFNNYKTERPSVLLCM